MQDEGSADSEGVPREEGVSVTRSSDLCVFVEEASLPCPSKKSMIYCHLVDIRALPGPVVHLVA
jgi:hypothetical protein